MEFEVYEPYDNVNYQKDYAEDQADNPGNVLADVPAIVVRAGETGLYTTSSTVIT